MRNFHQILVLLLRLRQSCAHADLTTKHYVLCGICEEDAEELEEQVSNHTTPHPPHLCTHIELNIYLFGVIKS